MTEINEQRSLTHIGSSGEARMVDVSDKPETAREARAAGFVSMRPETLEVLRTRSVSKGDVLAVARVAGIMAAKRTWDLIPLCHQLPLNSVEVSFDLNRDGVKILAIARTQGRTGVEMEALTAVSVAALTVYDMCKAIDRDMVIQDVRLLAKSGGRSGTYRRGGEALR